MRDVMDEAIGDTWRREGDGRRAWLVVLDADDAERVERAADACGESVMAFALRATLRLAAQVPAALRRADVLATEQERDTWRARAEFAERELSQALGLPKTVGPAPGEAARIVQRPRDERAVLRARLVDCRPLVER